MPAFCATAEAPKVTEITSALRNRLSLKAPKNCVRKNGRKRRVPSSRNCDFSAPGTCSGNSIGTFIACAAQAWPERAAVDGGESRYSPHRLLYVPISARQVPDDPCVSIRDPGRLVCRRLHDLQALERGRQRSGLRHRVTIL